jgi:hypothetical protein
MVSSEEIQNLADTYGEAAEDARLVEDVVEEQKQRTEEMKESANKSWLQEQPLSSHFDIEKKYAERNNMSLTDARKHLVSPVMKYEIEGKDIPAVIKDLRMYRRTLKGETKQNLTKAIDGLIDAYSDHLQKNVKEIYWISKYSPLVKDMICSEDEIMYLSKIDDENTRRDVIDTLCKYWEAKIDIRDLSYGPEYSVLHKTMRDAKKQFKATLRTQKSYLKNWSEKDEIKKHILYEVCEEPGVSVRQVLDRLPTKLQRKTTSTIISKMATSQNITNVNGSLYKFSDELKKDIYSYTAAFIDSDGYITMDKNHNPRVGLVATGDRGKAFMLEMHKSLGCGRLHLDQKSPQGTRPVNRLNFYSMDDVENVLTKCLPHFKMKKANAEILLELIRMKKSHKKADWYGDRKDELFKLMKYENHKDHVGYDFSQYNIDIDSVAKLHGNSKMEEMDRIEGVLA